MPKATAEIRCLSCAHAMIMETGVDLAGRRRTVHCGLIEKIAPPEVVECSSYKNDHMAKGRDLNEMVARATLITVGGDGRIIKFRIHAPREEEIYFAGHYWHADDKPAKTPETIERRSWLRRWWEDHR